MKEAFNWGSNPFAFRILPEHFVGYDEEKKSILDGINNGDKFTLLLGPTGSGKTTFIKHISGRLSEHKVIYIPKPPTNPTDWIGIFSEFSRPSFFSRIFRKSKIDLYTLSSKVNSGLARKKCVLFVDECHEATQESLEWLRTITDQVQNLTVVLAGLPIFENVLKNNLETFLRRVTLRIDLGCLSQVETREFIKKRIEGVGGQDIRPFTSSIIEYVHHKTGGFPREVLRACNEISQKAVEKGLTIVDMEFLKETDIPGRPSREALEILPPRQKLIVDILASEGELTPTEIVEKLQAKGDYKNTDNAIRSINNLVRRLMSDGLVERKRIGKAYKYKISPRYQTLLVNS